ncbi:hypothetical protein PALB_36870 [Pseudoalteromonas luteoviolacea B = ATCC 29581]|nr:hypothetical protein PALB_36870 [Pseudoalteromonas luteoviolacea B = ATCC 29581]
MFVIEISFAWRGIKPRQHESSLSKKPIFDWQAKVYPSLDIRH